MLADSFQVRREPTAEGPAGLGEDRDFIPVDPAVDNVRKLVDCRVGQIPREPREDGEREPVASRCGPALPWVETVGEVGAANTAIKRFDRLSIASCSPATVVASASRRRMIAALRSACDRQWSDCSVCSTAGNQRAPAGGGLNGIAINNGLQRCVRSGVAARRFEDNRALADRGEAEQHKERACQG